MQFNACAPLITLSSMFIPVFSFQGGKDGAWDWHVDRCSLSCYGYRTIVGKDLPISLRFRSPLRSWTLGSDRKDKMADRSGPNEPGWLCAPSEGEKLGHMEGARVPVMDAPLEEGVLGTSHQEEAPRRNIPGKSWRKCLGRGKSGHRCCLPVLININRRWNTL